MSDTPQETRITEWLRSIGMEQHASNFVANHITLETLRELTDGDLKECGVAALGDRKHILNAIRGMASQAAAPAPRTDAVPADGGEFPKKLGHFELLEPVGRGGMGTVYRAWDTSLSRQVAVKVLDPKLVAEDPQFVEDFMREARSAAGINHPHIVQVYFAGGDGGAHFIAMELLEGQSMAERLERGPMDEKHVLRLARQVIEALAATGARRLVHGDIKPHNIFITRGGDAKLLDFGLARKAKTGGGGGDFITGSASYMSPERVLRQPEDFRSDIYSLGATLFEAVCGMPPFDADTPSEVAVLRLKEDAPRLRSVKPGVSEALDKMIARMLAREPAARHASYGGLLADLAAAEGALAAAVEPLVIPGFSTASIAIEAAAEPETAAAVQPAVLHEPPPPTLWQRVTSRRFLFISIAVHVVFALVATILVVQNITAKRKLTFTASPPSPNPSQRALEHKVTMAKKQNTMSAPAQARRITSTGMAKVSLPDMPTVSNSTDFTPGKMAGMGGTGVGLGFAGGMGGAGGGGGGGIPFFGLRSGNGLVGTFYDLKQTRDGKPSEMTPKPGEKDGWDGRDERTNQTYDRVLNRFLMDGWSQSALTKYFRGPSPLYTTQIYIPLMDAQAAPSAFNLGDKVKGRRWIVVYRGKVTPPESGHYRFVGWADDMLYVRFGGRLVLDGTLMDNTTKHQRKRKYKMEGTGVEVPAGDLMDVTAGVAYDMEIVIGERPGGQFCAYLMIEKDDGKTPQGTVMLPIFKMAPSPMPSSHDGIPVAAPDTSWSVWKSQAQTSVLDGMM